MTEKKAKNIKKGKYSRNKGKRGERMIANMLKERGIPAIRGVQFKGGVNSHDIDCPLLDYYNLEVKFVETLNIHKAMFQATEDCGEGQYPVVVHKKLNKEILVTMRFQDWVNLVQWAHNVQDKFNLLELDRERFRQAYENPEVPDEELL